MHRHRYIFNGHTLCVCGHTKVGTALRRRRRARAPWLTVRAILAGRCSTSPPVEVAA